MSGYRLKRKEDLDDAIRRVAHAQITDALTMLTDEQADPAEAVHEARKDMKKLRSVLRLVRPVIGDSVYRQENRRFRDAGRILSDARDAKVRSTTLEQLSERFRDDPPPGGWFETIASIDGVAEVDVDEVRIHAAQMIEEGEHEIDEWPLGRDDISLLEPGLREAYRRGRRSFRAAMRDPSDESLHEWRKRAKDHWYHLRLVRNGWKPLLRTTAEEAEQLSDLLGDDHDLAVLRASLEHASTITDDRRDHIHRLIEARRHELQEMHSS
jgi:CHAD domain-containing protein